MSRTNCFLISDWHIGMIVRPEMVHKLNQFNLRVAEKRVNKLAQKINAFNARNTAKSSIVFLLGDFINAHKEDEIQPSDQPHYAQKMLIHLLNGISNLSDIYCAIGNHKSKGEPNGDETIYTILNDCIRDKKIHLPPQGEGIAKIEGKSIYYMHGSDYSQSFGASATSDIQAISYLAHKTRNCMASMGKHIDYFFMGHYHQFIRYRDIIVNNSLCGYPEYANKSKYPFSLPSQTAITLDSKYGIVTAEELLLTD